MFSFECQQIIAVGDFNLVFDISKDKSGINESIHFKSLKKLESLTEIADLADIWRILNPEKRRFTWRTKKANIQCRLDFFLISSSLCTGIENADILLGYKTDHSLVTTNTNTKSNPRGPCFWKLNTSLFEEEYVELITKTIYIVSK